MRNLILGRTLMYNKTHNMNGTVFTLQLMNLNSLCLQTVTSDKKIPANHGKDKILYYFTS